MSEKIKLGNLFKNYFLYLTIFTFEIIGVVIFFGWKNKQILFNDILAKKVNISTIDPIEYANILATYDKSIIYYYIMAGIIIISVMVMAVFIDILMRKRIETVKKLSYLENVAKNSEHIFQSEEKYRNLFNYNGTAICTVGPDELLTDCNAKFLEMTKYGRSEVIGKLDWKELVDKSDLKRVLAYDSKRKRKDGDAPAEYTLKLKSKYGDVINAVITVIVLEQTQEQIATMVDITEMVEKDKALKENEELLSQAMEIASMGSWTYFCDSKLLKGLTEFMHNLKITEVKENITLDYVRENLHFEQFFKAVNEMIRTNIPIDREISYLAEFSDEVKKTMYFKIKAQIVMENNKRTKIIGIIQDITEKKRIENEINSANKDLKNLLYVTSHDLQIPLISIEGFSNLLMNSSSERNLSDETKRYLERIQFNSKQMNSLFRNFFDMSKTNALKNPFELINTIDLIQSVISDNKILIEKYGVEIAFKDSESIPKIYGDRENLKLLYHHLITNAILYGGKKIELGYDDEKEYFVKDNGRGFNKEDLEKVFLPGERLEETGIEGTGMGLTFCRKVVDIHGGKIWAESEGKNKGAAFYFTLSYELIRN